MWERAWFSGLHERAIVIESLDGTHLVSARLHPLGALRLFGPDAPRNVNAVVDLELLLGPAARELRALLLGAESTEERFAHLERFLVPRLSPGVVPSTVVRDAARLIEEAHGNLRIASLHGGLGGSRKQLWLRFARELGMSPKAYAQIQRFVWTLARLRESTSVEWPRLAVAAGYSDQSHLVTRLPPRRLRQSDRVPANALGRHHGAAGGGGVTNLQDFGRSGRIFAACDSPSD